jgi:hypothetical protein
LNKNYFKGISKCKQLKSRCQKPKHKKLKKSLSHTIYLNQDFLFDLNADKNIEKMVYFELKFDLNISKLFLHEHLNNLVIKVEEKQSKVSLNLKQALNFF